MKKTQYQIVLETLNKIDGELMEKPQMPLEMYYKPELQKPLKNILLNLVLAKFINGAYWISNNAK